MITTALDNAAAFGSDMLGRYLIDVGRFELQFGVEILVYSAARSCWCKCRLENAKSYHSVHHT